MADRSEIAAGSVQGVALVPFPAAGTIFTSPSYYGLDSIVATAASVAHWSCSSPPVCLAAGALAHEIGD
jgi:hypothetical protein